MHISENKKAPILKESYSNYFRIGAAVNERTLLSASDLLKEQFNSLTAENEMKPEMLQPEEGVFYFDKSDRIVQFAQDHNMAVRGHTLVWHNQMPDWMFNDTTGITIDRQRLLERMKSHIQTVVKRYAGKIDCWDVVNEAIADESGQFLRSSKWLDIVGEDFIEKAFFFAHEADPAASLFYNDYNESEPLKRDKIFRLVKSLIEKEVPIHGVGMQAHWNIHLPTIDNIRRAIESYASLGLQVQITEMDVSVFDWDDRRSDLNQPTDKMKELQAERFEAFFKVFREYREVITSVTFWGAADDYTWLDDFPVRGRKNWPFLFDENHRAKKALTTVTSF